MISNLNAELEKVLQLLLLEKKHDYEQYRNKILQASLKDKKKEGVCWYPVVVRNSRIGTGEKQMLEIERTTDKIAPHSFQSGNVVRIFQNHPSGSNEVQGVINSLKKNELMTITLNNDELPEWINDGKLGVDLLFDEASYKEMEIAIKKVIEIDKGRLYDLKNILLGYKKSAFSEKHPVSSSMLNESQNFAFNNVLQAEDLAIIHGPPGTGKTTTLIQSIKQTLKAEKQVLACAPSNAAVDLLVEKLIQEDIMVIRIGHPARITEEILSNTIDSHIANHQHFRDIKDLRKKAEEYKRLALKYKRRYGKAERQQRKLLFSEASRCLSDADLLEHFIVNDLFQKASVIATTLVGAANYLLKGKSFSTVFIDEAGQALEPACWIPILKAERVVMAGDHQQLPPTVKSLEAAKEGLAETLFEKCIQRTQTDVLLKTQYRMHQKIMRFSSRAFYNNELIADEGVRSKRIFEDDNPFVFVDTAGCGYQEKINPDSRSYENPEEASLLINHLADYLTNIDPEIFYLKELDIGVISPYKAQVTYLKDRIEEHPSLSAYLPFINIDTIDSFQGRERAIIYISLVRSNDQSEIGFLKDIRRMNVAMTRAKMKLVMIGDSATLGVHPFYSDLLDFVTSEKSYLSAFEIMY